MQYVDIFKEFLLILLAYSNFGNTAEAINPMDAMLGHSNEKTNMNFS